MGPQSLSDSWLESLSTNRSEKDNVNRKLQTKERGDHLTDTSCLYTGEILKWKKRKKDKDKSKRRQKYDAKSKDVHNEKMNKGTDNEAEKMMVYKRVVSPASTEQDRLKTKIAETTSCLDSNRFADEDEDQDEDGR